MSENILTTEGLKKWYVLKGDKIFTRDKKIVKAVDGVGFELKQGEVLGVIGESGCGKSTLGRVLVGLEEPTDGQIYIEGEDAGMLLKKDSRAFRRKVQIVFQNPFDTFPPKHTIGKIMMRALAIHNIGKDEDERYQTCRKVLEDGGLKPADDYLSRYPHELSGGQLQRISILRSMILNPAFLVADEPVSMLDVSVRAEIINMLMKLVKEQKTALVFISHDITITRYISDRIAVMYLGRIVEIGESDEVIANPQHPYTQALISNCASIDFEETQEIINIEGEPPTPVNPGPGCYFADRCFRATEKCRQAYPEYCSVGDGHIVSCYYAEEMLNKKERR